MTETLFCLWPTIKLIHNKPFGLPKTEVLAFLWFEYSLLWPTLQPVFDILFSLPISDLNISMISAYIWLIIQPVIDLIFQLSVRDTLLPYQPGCSGYVYPSVSVYGGYFKHPKIDILACLRITYQLSTADISR